MRIAIVVLALLMVAPMAQADDNPFWSPTMGIDIIQPGFNLTGESREFHLSLVGWHLSLFRLGKFRFPTAGLDFQVRRFYENEYNSNWTGHFLLTSGITYVCAEQRTDRYGHSRVEEAVHFKVWYDTREDSDPVRVGRWGIGVGWSVTF